MHTLSNYDALPGLYLFYFKFLGCTFIILTNEFHALDFGRFDVGTPTPRDFLEAWTPWRWRMAESEYGYCSIIAVLLIKEIKRVYTCNTQNHAHKRHGLAVQFVVAEIACADAQFRTGPWCQAEGLASARSSVPRARRKWPCPDAQTLRPRPPENLSLADYLCGTQRALNGDRTSCGQEIEGVPLPGIQ